MLLGSDRCKLQSAPSKTMRTPRPTDTESLFSRHAPTTVASLHRPADSTTPRRAKAAHPCLFPRLWIGHPSLPQSLPSSPSCSPFRVATGVAASNSGRQRFPCVDTGGPPLCTPARLLCFGQSRSCTNRSASHTCIFSVEAPSSRMMPTSFGVTGSLHLLLDDPFPFLARRYVVDFGPRCYRIKQNTYISDIFE